MVEPNIPIIERRKEVEVGKLEEGRVDLDLIVVWPKVKAYHKVEKEVRTLKAVTVEAAAPNVLNSEENIEKVVRNIEILEDIIFNGRI